MPDWMHSDQLLLAFEVLVKLGVGCLLGGAIGYQREISGRPAGLRTHMLIVMGVVLICEASRYFGGQSDPSRIAAQIITGVGFLGAGTILRTGAEVRGLTSAASVWAASGVGMAIGAGGFMIAVAVVATVMTLLTLVVVDRIEARFLHMHRRGKLSMSVQGRSIVVDVLAQFTLAKILVRSVSVLEDAGDCGVTIEQAGSQDEAMRIATSITGVKSAHWVD